MKKKILIIAGAVVVVIVILIAIVAANLDKIINSRKGELLAQAKQVTGRDISVGDVGVALWPGIGVRVADVVVGEDPEVATEPFVTAKDLRVNLKLMPLLKKQVEIKRFVLNDPTITVIKLDAKRFNFTSLIERSTAAAPPGEGAGSAPASNAQAAFVLAVADIQNGTVRYIDRVTGMDRTIRDIDFEAKDVSVDSEMKAKIAAAVFSEEQDVLIEAKLGPIGADTSPAGIAQAPLSVSFTLEPTPFAALSAFAPPKPNPPPAAPLEGEMRATAKLSGTVGAAMIDEAKIDATALGAKEPNVAVTMSGGPFNLVADSTLVFADARMKGEMKAGPIPLAGLTLPPPKDPKQPKPVLGGDVSANATFNGAVGALAFDGVVDATNATYEIPAQFKKAAGIPAKATCKGTFVPQGLPDDGITFSKIDIVLHSLTAQGSGIFVPFKGHEQMDFSFDGKTALAPWKDLLPAMAPMAPTGDAKVTLRVSGTPKPGAEPDIRGTATLTNFGAQLPAMPKPLSNGFATVSFTAKSAHIPKATFAIGRSDFVLSADVPSFKPLQATYTITSIDVERLDVQAPAPNAKPLPRPEMFRDVVVKGQAVEKAPKVVENALTITSKSGVASNIDYTDAEAVVRATPEKSIIDRFSAKAMGGSISGSGTFEPKISKFDLSTKVEKVNLAEYFRYKSPLLADVLVGRIDADLNIGGQGKTWEELQKTLSGQGGALVIEGAFLNVNLAQQLFTSVQSMPLVPAGFTDRIKAKNPKLFAQNNTTFQNLAGKVAIADGKINTNDLHLKSSDFSLTGDGWFSFAKTMDLNTTLVLSQKLTGDLVAEVPMAKYLLNSKGLFEIPIKLSGAVAKPSVGVDANAIQSRLQQGLMQQGKDDLNQKATDTVKELLGGFGKKKTPAPPDTTKK